MEQAVEWNNLARIHHIYCSEYIFQTKISRFSTKKQFIIRFMKTFDKTGCGTGQLSNFLGIAKRDVFGTDMCLNSLRLAEDFRRKNNLNATGFYQMNLFHPIFKEETFDLLITNGVLHHTSDPFEGFKSIVPLVKRGGYIIVGLYNKYGRLMTDLRRQFFRLTSKKFFAVDPYLRKRGKRDAKMEAWFADQYQNPHESKHTIGEVLKWFDQNGL